MIKSIYLSSYPMHLIIDGLIKKNKDDIRKVKALQKLRCSLSDCQLIPFYRMALFHLQQDTPPV